MAKISRHHTAVVGGGLALAVLLAGCGADNGDDNAEPSAGEPADSEGEGDGDEPEESGDVIELSFAHYLGAGGGHQVSLEAWADDINEATDGRVEVEFFWSEGLLDATEILPGVADGRASMGYTGAFYHPGELVLSDMAAIPFLTTNSDAQIRAFHDLYQQGGILQEEYHDNGVHALLFPPIASNILGAPEPIETLEELDGRSIRATGAIAESIELAGANAVGLAAPEMYESLERGVIDAYTSFAFELVTDLGMHEVAPHVVDPGLGNYTQGVSIIGLDTWEGLPEDVQQSIEEVSAEYHQNAVADFLVGVEDDVCQEILEGDGSATVWDESEITEFEELVGDRFRDQWSEEAANKWGDEGEQLLTDYTSLLEEYEQESDYEPGLHRCAEG